MRRFRPLVAVVTLLVSLSGASAVVRAEDWIVLDSGARTRVQGLQIGERAVDILTLHGKRSALIRRVVDISATREANGMADHEMVSPGWPDRSVRPVRPVPNPQVSSASSGLTSGELTGAEPAPVPLPQVPATSQAPTLAEPPRIETKPMTPEPAVKPRPSSGGSVAERSPSDSMQGVEPPSRTAPPSTLPPTASTAEEQAAGPREPVADPAQRTRLPPPAARTTNRSSLLADAGELASRRPRLAVFVNGAQPTTPLSFVDASEFELFREQARIQSSYEDPIRPGIEIGAWLRVGGPVALGASMELFNNRRSAAYEALLPHPFFFDQFRELSGERDLSHRERALHFDAVLTKQFGHHFSVDLFGGPSLFFTRTEIIVDVLFDEVYPYQSVVDRGVRVEAFNERPLGFNLGASATYRLYRNVGLDFGFRFSRARVVIQPPAGTAIEFDGGGLRAGAGLRLLFP